MRRRRVGVYLMAFAVLCVAAWGAYAYLQRHGRVTPKDSVSDITFVRVGEALMGTDGMVVAYCVWRPRVPDGHAMESMLVLTVKGQGRGCSIEGRVSLSEIVVADTTRFYVDAKAETEIHGDELRIRRPKLFPGNPIDCGKYDVKKVTVCERAETLCYICYGKYYCHMAPETCRLEIPRGCFLPSVSERLRFDPRTEDWAYPEDMKTGCREKVRLEEPFLFFPTVSYYDDEGAGVLTHRSYRLDFKCPSQKYAVENVLRPITNALERAQDVHFAAYEKYRDDPWEIGLYAFNGTSGICYDVLLHTWSKVHSGHDGEPYVLCTVMVSVRLTPNEVSLASRKRAWDKGSALNWKDRRRMSSDRAYRFDGRRFRESVLVFDALHPVSPAEVVRQQGFADSNRSADVGSSLDSWFVHHVGVSLGTDARTVPWLTVGDAPVNRDSFRALDPNQPMEIDGWTVEKVHANRTAVTIFGFDVVRRVATAEEARGDFLQVMRAVEGVAGKRFVSRVVQDQQGNDLEPAIILDRQGDCITLELPQEDSDGRWSYRMKVSSRRHMQFLHITGKDRCVACPW